MTPEQYHKLRQHSDLLKEAKKLVEYNHNKTVNIKKLIAFKQKAGMMSEEYIEEYDHCWDKKKTDC